MSSKIPTAEEFFNQYSNLYQFEEGDPEYLIDKEDFKSSIIEFAKLHVKEAVREYIRLSHDRASPEVVGDLTKGFLEICYQIENIK